jgi:hypothetical protein
VHAEGQAAGPWPEQHRINATHLLSHQNVSSQFKLVAIIILEMPYFQVNLLGEVRHKKPLLRLHHSSPGSQLSAASWLILPKETTDLPSTRSELELPPVRGIVGKIWQKGIGGSWLPILFIYLFLQYWGLNSGPSS